MTSSKNFFVEGGSTATASDEVPLGNIMPMLDKVHSEESIMTLQIASPLRRPMGSQGASQSSLRSVFTPAGGGMISQSTQQQAFTGGVAGDGGASGLILRVPDVSDVASQMAVDAPSQRAKLGMETSVPDQMSLHLDISQRDESDTTLAPLASDNTTVAASTANMEAMDIDSNGMPLLAADADGVASASIASNEGASSLAAEASACPASPHLSSASDYDNDHAAHTGVDADKGNIGANGDDLVNDNDDDDDNVNNDDDNNVNVTQGSFVLDLNGPGSQATQEGGVGGNGSVTSTPNVEALEERNIPEGDNPLASADAAGADTGPVGEEGDGSKAATTTEVQGAATVADDDNDDTPMASAAAGLIDRTKEPSCEGSPAGDRNNSPRHRHDAATKPAGRHVDETLSEATGGGTSAPTDAGLVASARGGEVDEIGDADGEEGSSHMAPSSVPGHGEQAAEPAVAMDLLDPPGNASPISDGSVETVDLPPAALREPAAVSDPTTVTVVDDEDEEDGVASEEAASTAVAAATATRGLDGLTTAQGDATLEDEDGTLSPVRVRSAGAGTTARRRVIVVESQDSVVVVPSPATAATVRSSSATAAAASPSSLRPSSPRTSPSSSPADFLAPKTEVHTLWSAYKRAVVVSSEKDGAFVRFVGEGDGGKGDLFRAPCMMVEDREPSVDELGVDCAVIAKWNDGDWYEGVITMMQQSFEGKARLKRKDYDNGDTIDHHFSVLFEDSDKLWIPLESVRCLRHPTSVVPGQCVMVREKSAYYVATVSETDSDSGTRGGRGGRRGASGAAVLPQEAQGQQGWQQQSLQLATIKLELSNFVKETQPLYHIVLQAKGAVGLSLSQRVVVWGNDKEGGRGATIIEMTADGCWFVRLDDMPYGEPLKVCHGKNAFALLAEPPTFSADHVPRSPVSAGINNAEVQRGGSDKEAYGWQNKGGAPSRVGLHRPTLHDDEGGSVGRAYPGGAAARKRRASPAKSASRSQRPSKSQKVGGVGGKQASAVVRRKWAVGDAVWGNWGGHGQWFGGFIQKVHDNGSYDIKYLDNDEGLETPPEHIRPRKGVANREVHPPSPCGREEAQAAELEDVDSTLGNDILRQAEQPRARIPVTPPPAPAKKTGGRAGAGAHKRDGSLMSSAVGGTGTLSSPSPASQRSAAAMDAGGAVASIPSDLSQAGFHVLSKQRQGSELPQPFERLVFLVTGLSKEERPGGTVDAMLATYDHMCGIIRALGGLVVAEYSEVESALAAASASAQQPPPYQNERRRRGASKAARERCYVISDKPRLTTKYLYGLAAGLTPLHFLWVLKVAANVLGNSNQLEPIGPYVLAAGESKKIGMSISCRHVGRDRPLPHEQRLLGGKSVMIYGGSTNVFTDTWQPMLIACGARLTAYDPDELQDVNLVLFEQRQGSGGSSGRPSVEDAAIIGPKLVSQQWLKESIVCGSPEAR